MMQAVPGGAAAQPFVTQHKALGCNFYLRIALELYLKRMLVGGIDRVFEIGRIFRNEGLSRKHNPEFTMLEAYQAYGDYESMMELVQSMICQVAEKVLGTLVIKHEVQITGGKIAEEALEANKTLAGAVKAVAKQHEELHLRGVEKVIDLTPPWRRVKYKDLVREVGGRDWFDVTAQERRRRAIEELKLAGDIAAGYEDFEVTGAVFEKLIEPTLIQPTFVTHLPKELVPLAKLSPDDPTTVEVFECCINGQEIAPAYKSPAGPALRPPGGRRGRAAGDGRGLPHRPALRHAARRRHGPGHRSSLHDAVGPGKHPRRDPVPAVEAEVRPYS